MAGMEMIYERIRDRALALYISESYGASYREWCAMDKSSRRYWMLRAKEELKERREAIKRMVAEAQRLKLP